MTPVQFASTVRFKTRTNATTFTDADILLLTNSFKDEISSLIVEKNSGYFLIPTTFDLVANQREYSFTDTLLNRIHKLEIRFSATDSRFPSKAVKDYLGSETESEIVRNYSNSPGGFAYYIRRRSLFILSGAIAAVTAGGRLWSHIYPADLANLTGTAGIEVDPSTTTFGFPRQFHELLARRVAIEYKGRQPKPIPLAPMELNYERDLQKQLDAIASIDNSAEYIGEFPDPEDIWNDGWDT